MNAHSPNIDLLQEREVPEFVELVNSAFVTAFQRLAGREPPGRRVGDRVRGRFYRPDTQILVARDDSGALRGVLPLQRCGTRCVPGPLAIAPEWQEPWRRGVAAALVDGLLKRAVSWRCGVVDSVTFAQSTAHFALYWTYGAPIFQALLLARSLGASFAGTDDGAVVRFGALDRDAREAALSAIRGICGRYYDGYDVTADVLHVQHRGLGDTFVMRAEGQVLGFAICHFGPLSEAYSDEQVLIKYLYVDPQSPDPRGACERLLASVESQAARTGLTSAALVVSSARRATVELLLTRGYRTLVLESQWLMVPNAPGSDLIAHAASTFRSSQYALADWR
jgi:hypothetical protein